MPTYGNYGFGPETKFFDNPLNKPTAFLPDAPLFAPPGATLSPPSPLAPTVDRSYAGASGDSSGPGPGASMGPKGNATAVGPDAGKDPGGDKGTVSTAAQFGLLGLSLGLGVPVIAAARMVATPALMANDPNLTLVDAWRETDPLSLIFGPDDASSVSNPAHAQAIQAAMDADAADPDSPAKDAAAQSSDAAAAVRGALAAIGLAGEDGSDPGMGNPAGAVGADGIGVGNATAGIGFGSIGAGDGGGEGPGGGAGPGGEGATAGQGFGSIGAGDGGQGGDGGDSGGSVICTELRRIGLLDRDAYVISATARGYSAATYRGYHAWAVPYVRVMRRKDWVGRLATALIKPIVSARAEEMAYIAGRRARPSWRGRLVRLAIEPACFVLGHIVKATDYRKHLYQEGKAWQ